MKKIEPQLKYSDLRQVIFELLGEGFVSIHFPNENEYSTILHYWYYLFTYALCWKFRKIDLILSLGAPSGNEARAKLRNDGETWLLQQVLKCARELGASKYIDISFDGKYINFFIDYFFKFP